jgi:hypothetical protein
MCLRCNLEKRDPLPGDGKVKKGVREKGNVFEELGEEYLRESTSSEPWSSSPKPTRGTAGYVSKACKEERWSSRTDPPKAYSPNTHFRTAGQSPKTPPDSSL